MPATSISRASLMTLEAYAAARGEFRARVIGHKKNRSVQLGEHVRLAFEDELTIRYQIQEMLRIEKTFDWRGIQDELDAYAPLVPDGSNLMATMMIEYEIEQARRVALAELRGIERQVLIQVDGFAPVRAIADEDMGRDNESKTSSVHFLRFEFTRPMIIAFRDAAPVAIAIEHPGYKVRIDEIDPRIQAALARDFSA